MNNPDSALTYAVDIEAADLSVKKIQEHVKSTYTKDVLSSGETSFGGCFAFDPSRYSNPVLVSGTDGVGTKSEIASKMKKYDTIGIDLVASNIDDVAAQGAKPLFFLDYISVGKVDPDMMEQIVSGIASACKEAGVALIGGEMSEHPDLIEPGHFDLSGTATGVIEKDRILPQRIAPGDVIMGIDSPGIRANGYTLVRDTFLKKENRDLESPAWEGSDRSLGEELLLPSVLYSPVMQTIFNSDADVHGCAHITGGGIPGNVVRILNSNIDAVIDMGTWSVPRIFSEIQKCGNIADAEMQKVFNMGIGYVCIVPEDNVGLIETLCDQSGRSAFRIGEVANGTGRVVLR
ncbi:MAG TPA: phosphoribosylformylglycinamidine cyclo-ligase [Acidimicrobiia bacterium]|nr:phosphoribosylformylglycinamidine cyclo-ligase [Acidimicrobiia bacterium]